jgi:hypothetical protein
MSYRTLAWAEAVLLEEPVNAAGQAPIRDREGHLVGYTRYRPGTIPRVDLLDRERATVGQGRLHTPAPVLTWLFHLSSGETGRLRLQAMPWLKAHRFTLQVTGTNARVPDLEAAPPPSGLRWRVEGEPLDRQFAVLAEAGGLQARIRRLPGSLWPARWEVVRIHPLADMVLLIALLQGMLTLLRHESKGG